MSEVTYDHLSTRQIREMCLTNGFAIAPGDKRQRSTWVATLKSASTPAPTPTSTPAPISTAISTPTPTPISTAMPTSSVPSKEIKMPLAIKPTAPLKNPKVRLATKPNIIGLAIILFFTTVLGLIYFTCLLSYKSLAATWPPSRSAVGKLRSLILRKPFTLPTTEPTTQLPYELI